MTHSRRLRQTLCMCLVATVVSGRIMADEVVLKNGTVLVGKTRKLATDLEVTTLDGVRRVKLVDIERIRTDAQLRESLGKMAMRSGAGSAHAQLELARVARSWGLLDEMWQHLARALRSGEKSSVIQRRARDFMADLEREILPKKWRRASPEIKARELLFRIKRGKIPRAKVEAVAILLAKVPDTDQYLRKRARRDVNRVQRVAMIRALAARPTEGNDRFVYRTALLDGSPEVRREAMQATREAGHATEAIAYLSPGLTRNNAKMRMRTAQAFGELRDASALPLLVAAGPSAGTIMKKRALPSGATRAHMAVITQRAFVRDFDVEVASSAFIANPKVGVLQSGVVLDVTVIAVKTHRIEIVGAYRDAIRRIAGSDPGANPEGWSDWLKQHLLATSKQPVQRK
ncbi:MAG: hypothetical protein VX951_08010 [Planctomycetota bacterium]|nr:hypothetical protein [Planctomycetota bacterium]